MIGDWAVEKSLNRQIPNTGPENSVWYIGEFMLSLNLARIRTAQERFEFVYEPGAFPDKGESFGVVAPITLAFDIYKDKDQFRLVGGVQTNLELMCSRCLEPFTLPVDASFDLRYHPHALNTGEGEREVEEDDLTTAFYENTTATAEFQKASGILSGLWEKVRDRPDEFLDRTTIDTEGIDTAVRDFIAGMTDRYAIRLFEQLFIPKPWSID